MQQTTPAALPRRSLLIVDGAYLTALTNKFPQRLDYVKLVEVLEKEIGDDVRHVLLFGLNLSNNFISSTKNGISPAQWRTSRGMLLIITSGPPRPKDPSLGN